MQLWHGPAAAVPIQPLACNFIFCRCSNKKQKTKTERRNPDTGKLVRGQFGMGGDGARKALGDPISVRLVLDICPLS